MVLLPGMGAAVGGGQQPARHLSSLLVCSALPNSRAFLGTVLLLSNFLVFSSRESYFWVCGVCPAVVASLECRNGNILGGAVCACALHCAASGAFGVQVGTGPAQKKPCDQQLLCLRIVSCLEGVIVSPCSSPGGNFLRWTW